MVTISGPTIFQESPPEYPYLILHYLTPGCGSSDYIMSLQQERPHPAVYHAGARVYRSDEFSDLPTLRKFPQHPKDGCILAVRSSPKEVSFGRSGRNDVIIQDRHDRRFVSRQHITIRFHDGDCRLRDQQSSNGILLNVRRLEKDESRDLNDGDFVTISAGSDIQCGHSIFHYPQNGATMQSNTERVFSNVEGVLHMHVRIVPDKDAERTILAQIRKFQDQIDYEGAKIARDPNCQTSHINEMKDTNSTSGIPNNLIQRRTKSIPPSVDELLAHVATTSPGARHTRAPYPHAASTSMASTSILLKRSLRRSPRKPEAP